MSDKNNSLRDRILEFEQSLNDDSDFFCGEALEQGKGLEKKLKAIKNLTDEANPDDVIIVIDSTVWGSVEEGFCITEEFVYGKELLEDKRWFHIPTINNIYVDEANKALVINGTSIKWLSDEATPKMEIIAQCIREHVDCISEIDTVPSANLENLKEKINNLLLAADGWSNSIESMVANALLEAASNGGSFGDEGFLERTAISFARDQAISDFKKVKLDIEKKVEALNASIPVKQVNEILANNGGEKVIFSFDCDISLDQDTSITNENWSENIEVSFSKLEEAAFKILEQTQLLLEKLTETAKTSGDKNQQ